MDYSVTELRQQLNGVLDRIQGLNIPYVVNELKLMNTGIQDAWQGTNDPNMHGTIQALHAMVNAAMDVDSLHDRVISGLEEKRAIL